MQPLLKRLVRKLPCAMQCNYLGHKVDGFVSFLIHLPSFSVADQSSRCCRKRRSMSRCLIGRSIAPYLAWQYDLSRDSSSLFVRSTPDGKRLIRRSTLLWISTWQSLLIINQHPQKRRDRRANISSCTKWQWRPRTLTNFDIRSSMSSSLPETPQRLSLVTFCSS